MNPSEADHAAAGHTTGGQAGAGDPRAGDPPARDPHAGDPGVRHAEGRLPRLRRTRLGAWWQFAAVLAAGLALATIGGRMVVGGAVMAGAFVLAAGVRLVLPERRAGGLHVRSKAVDVVTLLALAVLVLGAVLAVDFAPLR